MPWYTTFAVGFIGFVIFPICVGAACVYSEPETPTESMWVRAPFLILPLFTVAMMTLLLVIDR